MIADIPDTEFFLGRCIDYHMLALDSIKNIIQEYGNDDLNDFETYHAELEDTDDALWGELDLKIGNNILLIFNSIESYLKYKVSQISPYLLIETPVKDWTWQEEPKPFHKFYMHPFDSLLKIYAVTYIRPTPQIRNIFEELRIARNIYVHGAVHHKTSLKKVLEISHQFITEIWNEVKDGRKRELFNYLSDKLSVECPDIRYDPDHDDINENHYKLLEFYKLYIQAVGKKKALQLIGLTEDQPKKKCIFCDFNNNPRLIPATFFAIEEVVGDDTIINCQLCGNGIDKVDPDEVLEQ